MTKKQLLKLKPVMIVLTLVTITVFLYLNLFIGFSRSAASGSVDFASTVIVIDAGHGGFDPGAVYGGYDEKDINLRIALTLRNIFESYGYTVVMTRTDDSSTESNPSLQISKRKTSDIHNRVALAEKYTNSILISIHQNAFSDRKQHGTQVFYGTQSEKSKALAEYIRIEVKNNLQPMNTRETKKGTSDIYILKNCKVPTVLVECGFMTNADDLTIINDIEYVRKLAFCIFCGYIDYETSLVG